MDVPNFCGPTYRSQSPIQDVEDLINFYIEKSESEGATSRYALYPSPGFRSFASSALSPGRGEFQQDGRAFAVIGFGFFEVLSDGTLIQRGTVDADANPAIMCSSGTGSSQLVISSGGKVYVYNLITDTLSAPISGLVAQFVAFLDGFFLALNTINSELRISEFQDGLTWPPLQFRVRSVGSDKWASMIVIHGEIWLIGTKTYEVWTNLGTSPFPFGPVPNVFYAQGIGAPYSIAQIGESACWLSLNDQGGGMVLISDQYSPVRISNHAVEFAIQNYTAQGFDASDAVSMTFQMFGHTYYVLTFLDADETWVYDLSTQMWQKWLYWNTGPVAPAHFEAWRPLFHMFAFGKHLMADRASGQIYEAAGNDFWLDAGGSVIRRVRTVPQLFAEKRNVFFKDFELNMQVGNGIASGQGSNPLVMMAMSNNGGRTYGNERTRSSGEIGKFSQRVRWNQCGATRQGRVWQVSVSDPVPWRITGAYVKARAGLN